MNTGKRLLSVLMCIAMLLSMMTTFVFAGTDASTDVESAPAADVNTLTGANPTTDVAAPTIDATTIVVDSTVTAETTDYVLTWEGVEYSTYDVDGVATDMFVYGTNLFATVEAAQAVAPVGATYLIMTDGASGSKTTFTKPGNYYSEAYNEMPYAVGTAFDGSDWTLNADYTAKSVTLNGIAFNYSDTTVKGVFNLYGFTVSYGNYAFDFNYITAPVDVNIQNVYYLPTTTATTWICFTDFAKTDAAATSLVQFKNLYLGGSTARFASEYVPNYFTIDGFYVPADVDTITSNYPYLKQGYNSKASHMVLKNFNIQNEDLQWYFQGNNTKNWGAAADDTAISGAYNDKYFRAITIENCTFNNSALFRLSNRFMYMYANSTSMFTIKGNRMINTTGTAAKLFVNNSATWGNHLGLDVTNNYFQGFVAGDSFASNVGNGNSAGINITDNYLSDGVSEIGTDLYVDSTADTYDWHSKDWYLDGAMTLKASDLVADSTVETNGIFDQNLLKLTLYVASGNTAAFAVSDATVAIADADASALAAGVYTVNVTKTVDDVEYTVPYTLTVVEYSAPLIQTLTESTGLIDGDKILLVDYAAANTATDGALVEVEWRGETYSAVKGITVFDDLSEAQAYAAKNTIDTPNFLIKSAYNSSTQTIITGNVEYNTFNVTYPGKYFTQNYDKKPYTASDRALDPTGAEWASNVDTGAEDSFNTEDGISVKWLKFNSAIAGKYELYGFTITGTIQDNVDSYGARPASNTIDVLIQNTYVNKTTNVALFTTGTKFWASNKSTTDTYAVKNQFKDTMYVKDIYIKNADSITLNVFGTGDTAIWRYTTVDGMYADWGNTTPTTGKSWITHPYEDHSFVLKNSNLRNADLYWLFQGDNGSGVNVKGTGKHIEFDNNIFYNLTLSNGYEGGFLWLKQGYHNGFKFTNNFVYTGYSSTLELEDFGYGGDHRQLDTWVVIDNNTLLGINNVYNANRWISATAARPSSANNNFVTSELIAEEDVLSGNITATGKTFVIYNNNHTNGVKNYTRIDNNAWLDYARTMKVSEVTKNIKAYVENGGFYITNSIGTVDAKMYLPSTATAADILINDMSPEWYNTDGTLVEDPTAITKDAVNITDDEGNVVGADYILRATALVGPEEAPVEVTYDINVNIVPNTVPAYGESTYEKIEAGEVNGKMTYTMEHPTETEVIEDMPHISGGLYDEFGMINSVNAALIDGVANYSNYKYSITAGEFKQIAWNGTTYLGKYGESLYQNVDAAYITEVAVGNTMPEYLLAVGEWSWVPTDGYYGGTSGNYFLRSPGKFFTENYYIDPYYAGDEYGEGWTVNVGSEEGMFNPDKYIKTANVAIDEDAKAGRYELYGFTIGTGIRDARTENVEAIDLYIKNAYFSCEAANNFIFYANETTNKAVMGGSPDSKLYIQNSYIASKGNRSFLRNSAWSDITFDAVYADFAENTKTATSYFHQTYDETSLVIKNSFFTNTLSDRTYFEGYNDGTNYYKGPFNEGKKSIVLENNVFKNYSFYGTGTFMNVKGGFLSEIILRNNYIDNSGNVDADGNQLTMKLFGGVDTFLTGVDPEISLVVENNTLIGFNGQSGITGTRTLSAESGFTGNLVTETAGGAAIALITPAGVANTYYLDSAKEILSTDLEIKSWTTDGVEYAVSNLPGNYNVIVTKGTGTPTVADITADMGDITVYSDAELTTAIDDLAAEGTSYVKIAATNSYDEEAALVYAVTVLGTSDNLFKDVYTAPETDTVKTKIDPAKAIVVDYAVNDAAFGELVSVSWMGTEYDFVKGVTAFATMAELNTYMSTADIENPHVLVKTISDGNFGSSYAEISKYGTKAIGEFQIRFHGSYYTENYNIQPYTVDENGVWAVNPEYVLENGIVARWIKVHNNLGAGQVELYGFAVTAAFQNTGEAATGIITAIADLYIENAYADSTEGYSAPRTAFQADSRYARTVANAAGGSLVVKNAYVSSANDRARILLPQANYLSTFELDGVFIDNSQATELYDRSGDELVDEATIILEGDSSITVKNSYATGAAYSARFVVLTEEHDAEDNNHAIVFDNNIFENITFAGKDAFIQIDGDYTDVQITNNTIKNDFDTANVVEVIKYEETEEAEDGTVTVTAADTVSTIPLKVTIENNTLIGFGADTETDRVLDEASSIDNNCVALVDMGGKALTIAGANITVTDANAKIDEDGTMSTSEIYGMTINGEAFDTDGQTADVEVRYNRTAIDLDEYLVNQYNVVKAYADAEMTEELDADAMPIDTTVAYLKVTSVDGTAVQTRIVNFTIGAAPAAAVEAVSATLYNDITMNFKTVGTEVYENVYVNFTLNGVSTSVSEYTVEGDYIVYHFENIAPHLMNETITVEIYGAVDGTAEVVGTYKTTLADYLYAVKDEYVDTYELYILAVDALNYGAAAQQYKKFNTDNLANANLTEDEQFVDDEYLENNFAVTELEGAEATWCAKGLYLDEAIDMKLAFKADDITGMTVEVKDAEGTVVETIDTFVNRDGKYYVYFDGFNVGQVDDEFTFTVMKDGAAVSGTVTYSVQYYAAEAFDTGIEDLANIVKAMMAYGRSAQLYVDTYLA